MNKDIIYIDVDDDITAIIGKVKSAKNKVIALVPPKRIGVLQSAVNLRLLARAAEQSDKRLVLISANSALAALAAAAEIPVARNLQSKPEIAAAPKLENNDTEDIIDGSELPVGDHARTGEATSATLLSSPAVDEAIRENAAEETPRTLPASPVRQPRATAAQRGIKIPNFDTFRKKMALGIGIGSLLIAFLVWAVWFAPHATILITARTIDTSANVKLTLDPNGKTDVEAETLKSIRKEIKKEATLTFDATGSKTVGEKSKGEVVFQNCETDSPQTVPAGTGISASGRTYITQASVTVPGAKGFSVCTQAGQSGAVAVVAQEIGEEYDMDEGDRFSVAGHSNSSTAFYFRAVATTDIAGGSKKTVTVVSEADVKKAKEQLAEQNNDGIKKQLSGEFGEASIGVDQTFQADASGLSVSPAVGEEAPEGKATLGGSMAYHMQGVEKSEAGRFLDAYFAEKIEEKDEQRIYDNGADKATFVDVELNNGKYSGTLVATAKIGPKIDDEALKSEARGKRYGDVQSRLDGITGVEDVDIQFSPFWVNSVPNDDKRIRVEFKLNESK